MNTRVFFIAVIFLYFNNHHSESLFSESDYIIQYNAVKVNNPI